MNKDILEGRWLQLKGKIREKWGKLTEEDLTQVQGSTERLIGRLQERYGYARDRAEDEIDAWLEQHEPAASKDSAPKREKVRT